MRVSLFLLLHEYINIVYARRCLRQNFIVIIDVEWARIYVRVCVCICLFVHLSHNAPYVIRNAIVLSDHSTKQ